MSLLHLEPDLRPDTITEPSDNELAPQHWLEKMVENKPERRVRKKSQKHG